MPTNDTVTVRVNGAGIVAVLRNGESLVSFLAGVMVEETGFRWLELAPGVAGVVVVRVFSYVDGVDAVTSELEYLVAGVV